MSMDQIVLMMIIAVMVAFFVWDRWRHDLVAVAGLIACVIAGLVPAEEAFLGFGHPAVITVAGVLVLSGALESTGAAGLLVRSLLPAAAGPSLTLTVMVCLAAALSAFMNNVGALALLMPAAIQIAGRLDLPPGRLLMPLAFGSILGGMTTLIGTPPNLIVAGFRAESAGSPFAMFDFAPVGFAVAAAGVAFIVVFGWRLVPSRRKAHVGDFDIGAYLTETRVPEKSKVVGMTPGEVGKALKEADAQIVGLVRDEARFPIPDPRIRIQAGDILVIEADPPALRDLLSRLGLKLEEDKPVGLQGADQSCPEPSGDEEAAWCQKKEKDAQSEDVTLAEMALFPNSRLVGRTVTGIQLRTFHHLNLLAVSRQNHRITSRLRSLRLASGDVLLLQGKADALAHFASRFGGVPLAERPLLLPSRSKALTAGALLVAGVGAAALGILPAAVSFTAAALLCVLLKLTPLRRLYESIDWPVVVLLGALIPVAHAMNSTGAAALIGQVLVKGAARGNPTFALVLIILVTMVLTSVMSNAATAAVMCPVAISTAKGLGASGDPFLMAVAVGASCAFLTPIGHQNNTLILGPGGFRFGDYWRLGLPMQVLVIAVAAPFLILIWPLY